MNKQGRYEFRYVRPNGQEACCYPKSKEKVEENRQKCKEAGMKVLSVKKLYPFNMEKNQHNFDLIANRCFNIMSDMETGEIPYNEAEYDKMITLREKAQRFFCYGCGIVWVPWEDLKEMRKISEMAVEIRVQTCIRTGRLQDIQYC